MCAIYAAFGSPTPSVFGVVEILIAALLFISIGFGRLRSAVLQWSGRQVFERAGIVFMLYGLSITAIVGLLNAHPVTGMVRDIIPFLFLFLPVFLGPLFAQRPEYARYLSGGCVMIGVVFAARSLWFVEPEEFLYLENMPTVLFAALLCIGLALSWLSSQISIRNVISALSFLSVSLIPLMAMAQVNQRASLGAAALYLILILFYFFVQRPAKTGMAAGLLFVFCLGIGVSFQGIAEMMNTKTQAVGLNMRPQEMAAVWRVVTGDVITFLFGIGWGGQFHSPAVGGVSVNFTHNFFSSTLLKMGLVGVVFAALYVLTILQKLSHVVTVNPVLGIALFAPVLIDLTLYASFKSLDFGLMLLMIVVAGVYLGNSRTESSIAERQCADRPLFS